MKPGRAKPTSSKPTSKWWNVAPARETRIKGAVFVADGTVTRIRAVDPTGQWQSDDRGYADIPLTALTDLQATHTFPTLGIRPGDHRTHVCGKIREYLPL